MNKLINLYSTRWRQCTNNLDRYDICKGESFQCFCNLCFSVNFVNCKFEILDNAEGETFHCFS